MCIVIDTNCMSSVFKRSSKDHTDFKPVKDWIIEGKGKIVIGGSKYREEIKHYLSQLAELERNNKVVKIDNAKVDREHDLLKEKIDHRDYDDPHLIALLSISRCKLICSKDERAYPFFKNKDLYQSRSAPLIYCKERNKDLLCDNNIAPICEPCIKLNKSQIDQLEIT